MNMSFGSYLKRKRESAGWTTVEMARRMGTTQSYISQLEIGHRFPSQKQLSNLAKAYRLPDEEVRERWTEGKIQSVSTNTEYKFNVKERARGRLVSTTSFIQLPILDSIVPADKLEARIGKATKFYSLPEHDAPHGHRLFGFRANGIKFVDAGILPGDLIVVDQDARPKDGDVVVVSTPDGIAMTYFHKRGTFLEMRPTPRGFKKTYHLKESRVIGRLVFHIKKY